MSSTVRQVTTDQAPPPAGTYSAAIVHNGLVYVSGQTARLPSGERLLDAPFEVQVRAAMDNLAAVARAAGTSLAHALTVTVYLRDQGRSGEFDEIYRAYVGDPPPARAIVQSDLSVGELEVTAVLALPA
ncbi:RidA family protein [Georgenia yuyongxinii]|uniref:RidA family protein n=1 Tax=Georgenia yuyongxinii TaxID=2589797 RepID=A0A552WSR5_9MICO|nr:RidA family protein [Georgenia yuyongxinii]TRW45888.1 RidA family protein [Georgenia yuyongxinii]